MFIHMNVGKYGLTALIRIASSFFCLTGFRIYELPFQQAPADICTLNGSQVTTGFMKTQFSISFRKKERKKWTKTQIYSLASSLLSEAVHLTFSIARGVSPYWIWKRCFSEPGVREYWPTAGNFAWRFRQLVAKACWSPNRPSSSLPFPIRHCVSPFLYPSPHCAFPQLRTLLRIVRSPIYHSPPLGISLFLSYLSPSPHCVITLILLSLWSLPLSHIVHTPFPDLSPAWCELSCMARHVIPSLFGLVPVCTSGDPACAPRHCDLNFWFWHYTKFCLVFYSKLPFGYFHSAVTSFLCVSNFVLYAYRFLFLTVFMYDIFIVICSKKIMKPLRLYC